jgi:hypothetical protein
MFCHAILVGRACMRENKNESIALQEYGLLILKG